MKKKSIVVEVFTDALCVWAYAAQIRIDELKRDFGENVVVHYRFIPVFSACRDRITQGWKDKGGFEGFSKNLQKTASAWEHVHVHPDIWVSNVPESSAVPHLYLKALQLLEQQDRVAAVTAADQTGRTPFEVFYGQLRQAFFERAENISDCSVIRGIATELDLPLADMQKLLDTGAAHAALHMDTEARDKYMVPGSPTLVFNEGRQRLYGNVGYRIIEANIRELMHDPGSGEASWC